MRLLTPCFLFEIHMGDSCPISYPCDVISREPVTDLARESLPQHLAAKFRAYGYNLQDIQARVVRTGTALDSERSILGPPTLESLSLSKTIQFKPLAVAGRDDQLPYNSTTLAVSIERDGESAPNSNPKLKREIVCSRDMTIDDLGRLFTIGTIREDGGIDFRFDRRGCDPIMSEAKALDGEFWDAFNEAFRIVDAALHAEPEPQEPGGIKNIFRGLRQWWAGLRQ